MIISERKHMPSQSRRSGRIEMMVIFALFWLSTGVEAVDFDEVTSSISVMYGPAVSTGVATAGVQSSFIISVQGTPRGMGRPVRESIAHSETYGIGLKGVDVFLTEKDGAVVRGESIAPPSTGVGIGNWSATITPRRAGQSQLSAMVVKQGGLLGTFYHNCWFFEPNFSQMVTSSINFTWGGANTTNNSLLFPKFTPDGLPDTFAAARWNGKITASLEDVYTFRVVTDGSVRLTLSNVVVIESWDKDNADTFSSRASTVREVLGTFPLVANAAVDLVLEYKHGQTDVSHLSLLWSSKYFPPTPIPPSSLLFSQHVYSSPFQLTVYPGLTCATQSTLVSSQQISGATAGRLIPFSIFAADAYSNRKNSSDEEWAIRLKPSTGRPRQARVGSMGRGGEYLATATVTQASTHTLFASFATVGGLQATYYTGGIANFGLGQNTIANNPGTDYRARLDFSLPTATDLIHTYVPARFGARWQGLIRSPASGVFNFQLSFLSDERVRFYLDQQLLVDEWTARSAAAMPIATTISLVQGGLYDIQVDYTVETTTFTSRRLKLEWWSAPLIAAAIPVSTYYLYEAHDLRDTPLSLPVQPGKVCSALSVVAGAALTSATAGIAGTFSISARDSFANDRTVGGDGFSMRIFSDAMVSAVRSDTVDQGNGKYSVSYVATRSGSYSPQLRDGRSAVVSLPVTLTVQPARRHMASSPVRGDALTLTTVGVLSSVTITVKDIHGNEQPAADWAIAAQSAGLVIGTREGVAVTYTGCSGGGCPGMTAQLVLQYLITRSGNYTLDLNSTTLYDTSVAGSPFSLTVLPEMTCSVTSALTGPAFSLSTVGVASSFSILLRDKYYNPRPLASESIAAFFRASSVGPLDGVGVLNLTSADGSRYNGSAICVTLAGANTLWSSLAYPGGLLGNYYQDAVAYTFLTTLKTTKVAAPDWSGGAGTQPDTTIAGDLFSIHWQGVISPPTAEIYTFKVTLGSNERTRLWIANRMLLNEWVSMSTTPPFTATVNFPVANALYDIVFEYGNTGAGSRTIKLEWASASMANTGIPTSRIFVPYHFAGSPYNVNLRPSTVCTTYSVMTGPSTLVASAGVNIAMTITARDLFNNLREVGGDTFAIDLIKGGSLQAALAATSYPWIDSSKDGGGTVVQSFSILDTAKGIYYASLTVPSLSVAGLNLRTRLIQPGGLRGEYFEQPDFTDAGLNLAVTAVASVRPFARIDRTIDMNWGTSAPVSTTELGGSGIKNIGPSFFSVRWTGSILPPTTAEYTFSVVSEGDGVRMIINGTTIVFDSLTTAASASSSSGGSSSPFLLSNAKRLSTVQGTVQLNGNYYHDVVLEYVHMVGPASIHLSWESRAASIVRTIVPSTRLFSSSTNRAMSSGGSSFYIMPNAMDMSRTYALGPGLTIATAGLSSSFTIVPRDAMDNEVLIRATPWAVRISPLNYRYTTTTSQLPRFGTIGSARGSTKLHSGGLTATYYNNFLGDGSSPYTTLCNGADSLTSTNCGAGPWGSVPGWDFSFAGSSPVSGLPQQFSVKWQGLIQPSAAGLHTFVLAQNAGDVASMSVAGVSLYSPSGSTVLFPVAGGATYDITIDYRDPVLSGTHYLQLRWIYPGSTGTEVIPTTRLFPLSAKEGGSYTPSTAGRSLLHVDLATAGGLTATFYDHVKSPILTRYDSTVDFDLQAEVAAATTPLTRPIRVSEMTGFYVVWEGFVKPAAAGVYTFQVAVQGAGGSPHLERFRLKVDDAAVLDQMETYLPVTATAFSGTVNLRSSTDYTSVRLEYWNRWNPAGKCKLQWCQGACATPAAFTTIPAANLNRRAPVSGSPFTVTIQPSAVCSFSSAVSGTSLTSATAGTQSSYTIQAFDYYGNTVNSSQVTFFSRLHYSSAVCPTTMTCCIHGNVTSSPDEGSLGYHTATYNTTSATQYVVRTSIVGGAGIHATYYSAGSFASTPVDSAATASISWTGTPIGALTFPWSGRWNAFLYPTYSGVFTFQAVASTSNERVRLRVDHKTIIDQWTAAVAPPWSATIQLAANTLYDLELDYNNAVAAGATSLTLNYATAGNALAVLNTGLYARFDVPSMAAQPTVTVSPATTSPVATTASGVGLSLCTVGTTCSFAITVRDFAGNLRSVDDDQGIFSTVFQDNALVMQANTTGDDMAGGTYRTTFLLTTSSRYTTQVAIAKSGGFVGSYYMTTAVTENTVPYATHTDSVLDAHIDFTRALYMKWTGNLKALVNETAFISINSSLLITISIDGNNSYSVSDSGAKNYSMYTLSFPAVRGRMHAVEISATVPPTLSVPRTLKMIFRGSVTPQQNISSLLMFNTATHIWGSPFSVSVMPNIVCSTASQVISAMTSLTAGVSTSFYIQARDEYGNKLITRDLNHMYFLTAKSLMSSARINPITVQTVVPGQFKASFALTTAGSAQITAALGLMGGLAATYYQHTTHPTPPFVNGGPAMGAASFSRTDATLDWSRTASIATLGSPVWYSVRWAGAIRPTSSTLTYTFDLGVNDASERMRLWVDNKLVVDQWVSLSATNMQYQMQFPLANSLYQVQVDYWERQATTTSSKLSFKWNTAIVTSSQLFRTDFPISATPMNVTVNPTTLAFDTLMISGSSMSLATAGSQATFYMTFRDKYGNVASSGSSCSSLVRLQAYPQADTFSTGSSFSADGFEAVAVDHLSGSCAVSFLPLRPGVYDFEVATEHRARKTWPIVVRQAAACSSMTYVRGVGVSLATSGASSTFTIWLHDEFNNSISSTELHRLAVQISDSKRDYVHFAPVALKTELGGVNNIGVYTSNYRLSRSGTYTLTVRLASQQGLKKTVFRDVNMTQPIDTTLSGIRELSSWWMASPSIGIASPTDPELFAQRWEGFLHAPMTGDYTFAAGVASSTTDRVRLWIRDMWLLQEWTSGMSSVEPSATIRLLANTLYDIRLEYLSRSTQPRVNLRWGQNGQKLVTIPTSYLFSCPSAASTGSPDSLIPLGTGISVANCPVPGSPFTITVPPTAVCGEQSVASGPGLSIATANLPARFTITAKDQYAQTPTAWTSAATAPTFVVVSRRSPRGLSPDQHGTVTASTSSAGNEFVAEYTPYFKANGFGGSSTEPSWQELIVSMVSGSSALASTYYDEPYLQSPSWVGSVSTVDWSVASAPPATTLPSRGQKAGGFSIRWAGFVQPGAANIFQFTFTTMGSTQERVRLWIDNMAVIDEWASLSGNALTGSYTFPSATDYYHISVEYSTTQFSGALARLSLTSPFTEILAATRLFRSSHIALATSAGTGLEATYYGDSLLQSVAARGSAPQVDWSATSFAQYPHASLVGDLDFGIRWQGFVRPSVAGVYTFYSTIGSTSEATQLWVNSKLLVDAWSCVTTTEYSGTIWLPRAGEYVPLTLLYKTTSAATSKVNQLSWKSDGADGLRFGRSSVVDHAVPTKTAIPSSQLFSSMSTSVETRDASTDPVLFPNGCEGADPRACMVVRSRTNSVGRIFVAPSFTASGDTSSLSLASGVSYATAGVDVSFTITVRDPWGNIVDSTNNTVWALTWPDSSSTSTSGALLTSIQARKKGCSTSFTIAGATNRDPNGRYAGIWSPTAAGTYWIQLALGNTSIGLLGETFQNSDFTGPTGTRLDAEFGSLTWNSGSNVTIRWRGGVIPPTTNTYTFFVNTSDCVRLSVDGRVLTSIWNDTNITGGGIGSGVVSLTGSVPTSIEILFRNRAWPTWNSSSAISPAWIGVEWESRDLPRQTLHGTYLNPLNSTSTPKKLVVLPGAVCGVTSSFAGSAVTLTTAGLETTFVVQARDSFGNNRTESTMSDYDMYARMTPPFTPTSISDSVLACSGSGCPSYTGIPTAGTTGTGQHTVTFKSTRAGNYSLCLSLPILGSIRATYYMFPSLDVPYYTSTPYTVNWQTTGVDRPGSIPAGSAFAARWEGLYKALGTETSFSLTLATNTERVLLKVNDYKVIDMWNTYTSLTPSGAVTLTSGRYYAIELWYRQLQSGSLTSQAILNFVVPGPTTTPIPSTRLFQRQNISSCVTRIIHSSNPCTTTSTMFGAALTLTTVGLPSVFTIAAKDQFSNGVTNMKGIISRSFPQEGGVASAPYPPMNYGTATAVPTSAARYVQHTLPTYVDTPGTIVANYTHSLSGKYALSVSFMDAPSGLTGQYWMTETTDIVQFPSLAATSTIVSPTIDYSYVQPAITPAGDITYAARWYGFIQAPSAGVFTFSLNLFGDTTARAQIWIDNVAILNQWTVLSAATPSATFAFSTSGEIHDITLHYKTFSPSNGIQLLWESSSTTKQVVPSSRLFERNDMTMVQNTATVTYHYSNPTTAAPPKYTAYGASLTILTAGVSATFVVEARDVFGNNRGLEAAPSPTIVVGAMVPGVNNATRGLSTFSVNKYSITIVGGSFIKVGDESSTYIHLTVNGIHAAQSPYRVKIVPGSVCGARCTVSTGSVTDVVVGQPAPMKIYARDCYDNMYTSDPAPYPSTFVVTGRRGGSTSSKILQLSSRNDGSGTHGPYVTYKQMHFVASSNNDGSYSVDYFWDSLGRGAHRLNIAWAQMTNGLDATYYSRAPTSTYAGWDFSALAPAAGRHHTALDFSNTGGANPFFLVQTASLPGTAYGVRWAGFVRAESTNVYTFLSTFDVATKNERMRLWVDEALVIDQWTSYIGNSVTGSVSLTEGKFYDILVDFLTNPAQDSTFSLQYYCCANTPQTLGSGSASASRDEVSGSPFSITVSA